MHYFVDITPCCQVSCCFNTTDIDSSDDVIDRKDELIMSDEKDFFQYHDRRIINSEVFHDYDPIGPIYQQASFWVLFIVLILVIGIVIRSVYFTIKPNRLVDLLKRMSTGPLSETKQGPEGNIEPVLHYYNPDVINQDFSEVQNKNMIFQTTKARKWIRSKIKDNKVHKMSERGDNSYYTESGNPEQILDAKKLLSKQLAKLEKSVDRIENNLNRPTSSSSRDNEETLSSNIKGFEVILAEDDYGKDDTKTSIKPQAASRRPSSSYALSIDIPGPLTPSYQPNLVVNNVWNTNMNMQRLYRYTTMQGCIYPPGYVP